MGKADKYNYGVVLDAGSSGTRVYIYRWLKNALARGQPDLLHKLPELETKDKWTKKIHPGVSTYGETPGLVGPDHLKKLIDHALDHIPKDAVANTPIFLLATAGMRLLPELQRQNVLDSICSYLKEQTNFYLPDCDLHIQVIPGETEGLYGWIAANYLLGGFDEPSKHDHGKDHHTYGFLDMGGASAQIAFAPNTTEADKHFNDLTLMRLRTVDGQLQEHKVFITTWLGFGVNEARKRYVSALMREYAIGTLREIPDPCLPLNVRLTVDGKLEPDLNTQHLIGTGQFDECMRRSLPLLEKTKPCLDEPCLINGQHVPAIDFDVNHFVGISEYWHTTHEIFQVDSKDKAYDFNTYQQRVSEFCGRDWKYIQAAIDDNIYGKKVNEQTAYEVCFKASWLINMLHDGIGVPRIGLEHTPTNGHNGTKEVLDVSEDKGFLEPFQAADKIRGTEISWTMGKMVLYASADVPVQETDYLPVGFGTNAGPGVLPADFQEPGGGRLQPGSLSVPDQSFKGKIKDTLLSSDSPHRVPGFLFFLLIILIAFFYIRRRRNAAGPKIYSRRANSSSMLGKINRLLGRPGSKDHGRELEDGQRLYDPADFELGDMDDSEDEGKLAGRISPVERRNKSSKGSLGSLGRLTPPIIDRAGLLVRTESRENFETLGGRKSRNTSRSPTRLK